MQYILVLIPAALLSLLLTRAAARLATARGWLDMPSPRRVHSRPTPRVGGASMYLSFAVVVVLLAASGRVQAYTAVGLLGAAGALMLVGLADDLWGLGAGTKLLFQVASSMVVAAAYNISMESVTLPAIGTLHLANTLPGYLLTLFWLLGMINTVNLADGIDGLAAGLGLVFALLLLIVGIKLEQTELALYAAALGGVTLGFLRYNFSPASVFMGDSGSMFLGLTMGTLAIAGGTKLATALLVMGLPVADVAYSIVRRVRAGTPVQMPDKEHLHHRFVMLGLSQRDTALLFYGLALGFGSAALIPDRTARLSAVVLLAFVAVGLIWTLNQRADAGRETDGA